MDAFQTKGVQAALGDHAKKHLQMSINPYDRRNQRGGGGGDRHRGQSNPFEMMDSHMSQMQTMMDGAFGGRGQDPFAGMMGGRDSLLGGGGLGSMTDSMMSAHAGGGGGCSYSSSSCCYSSSSSGPGGQPHVVQYSSSSHGTRLPGQDMVQETHRNYHDSTGQEQLGVSRRIGDRGRSMVAERRADGTEQRTDNLINVNDGTAFDNEWRGNAGATHINNARTQMRTLQQQGGGDPFGSMLMGPGGRSHQQPRPQLTNEDREAARAGARLHEHNKQRIMEEARKQRDGTTAAAARPQLGYQSRGSGHSMARGARGGDDALASRLAADEARRAGLY